MIIENQKSYDEFLAGKLIIQNPDGFDHADLDSYSLFPFQRAIVAWACKRGKAAVFADTGLGKTRIQLAWSNEVIKRYGGRVIIFCPLCVASQTIEEGKRIGIGVAYAKSTDDCISDDGIYITNYERIQDFEEALKDGFFTGIVLDESSILKHESSSTRRIIIESSFKIPFRLSCTATPSPNDFMELGYQAEFIGVMNNSEMLATFFTHDGGETSKWRLKGHGKTKFWEWLSTWAICIKKPSDFGFSDDGYILKELVLHEHIVGDEFFVQRASSMSDRNKARRESIVSRVESCSNLINSTPGQWIVWCHLNDESSQLKNAIMDSIEIRGSDSLELKEEKLQSFTVGTSRVLITKPSIAGFGMNWQHCNQMAFVGINDSYEELYQAIRRCYRFGQLKDVTVHLFIAQTEGNTLRNIKRKQLQHDELSKMMVNHMRDHSKKEIGQLKRDQSIYSKDVVHTATWSMYLGDCIEVLDSLPGNSIDYSIFSPPFSSLYTYSNSDRDMGNSRNDKEFFSHFSYFINGIFKVMAEGRLVSVHCTQLTASLQRDGYIGLKDFRGDIIRAFQRGGFIYHSEVAIWKDPVVAMQRTKALGLLWKQIKKDSAMSRNGLPDYIVTFRKPGMNLKPINHDADDFPVEEWQNLASPFWIDIDQGLTLQRLLARENDDERHICPLQLEVIRNCIRLWSNEGDTVLSPFAGIGSEGYVCGIMGRKFIGIELKKSYYEIALKNLSLAKRETSFDKSALSNVKELQARTSGFTNKSQKSMSRWINKEEVKVV